MTLLKYKKSWLTEFFRPDPVLVLVGFVVAVLASFYSWYSMEEDADRQKRRIKREADLNRAAERARAHQEEQFGGGEKIIRVRTEEGEEEEEASVLVAVGYGRANCILVRGANFIPVVVSNILLPDPVI